MKIVATELPGVLLVEPDVFRDPRGFFLETWQEERYREAGIPGPFVQDNHSRSARGILRGLHTQVTRPQGKLLRCSQGEIFDVAVDVRRGSPSFGRWIGVVLSADNLRQLYIPAGFAHGFCVTSETADVEYKCTAYYAPEDEIVVAWDDPAIGIRWPVTDPVLSKRDAAGLRLDALGDRLPRYAPA